MRAPAGSPLVLCVKALHFPLRQLLLQPVQRLLVLLPLAGVGLVGMLRLRLHSLPAAGAGGRQEQVRRSAAGMQGQREAKQLFPHTGCRPGSDSMAMAQLNSERL